MYVVLGARPPCLNGNLVCTLGWPPKIEVFSDSGQMMGEVIIK